MAGKPERRVTAERDGAGRGVRAALLALALAAFVTGLAVWRSAPAPPLAPAPAPGALALPEGGGARQALGARHAAPRAADDDQKDERLAELTLRARELLELEEFDGALILFEECYHQHPERDVFRRNLAEALVRTSRHLAADEETLERAIAALARAIELAPERDDVDVLRELLDRWSREREVARNHTTDESNYFELSYDADRSDILHHSGAVIDVLERDYGDLRDWFGVDPIVERRRARIRVVFYNREEFDRVTGLGDWAGGAFDGTVRISVEDLQSERRAWEPVLRHELVHAFVHEVGGVDVPGWLNEGLAQWLVVENRGRALELAKGRLVGLEPLFSFEELGGSLAGWSDPERIRLAYAQSLVLVDHVASVYGEHVLRAMVAACAAGGTVAEAFEEKTAVPLDFVLRDLPHYL